MNPIFIHKGDDTIFADVTKFLTFNIATELDLKGFKAQFTLAYIKKTIDDISSKSFDVVLTASDTSKLWLGEHNGKLILTDDNGNRKTISTTIPFIVTNDVVENQPELINLDVPQTSGVDIELKVGGGDFVASVNGKKGKVILTAEDVGALPADTEIPSIIGLATEQQLNDGLETKQDVISDLESIRSNASKGATALQSIPDEYITETELETELETKQDVISDLESIRNNASKGATALQSYTETDPIYTADKPNLATKDELTKYLETKQDVISDLETIRSGASKGATALQSVPSEYITETELENKGYLTSYTETDPIYTADKPNLALKSEIPTNNNQLTNGAGYITAEYHDSTKQDVISDLDIIRSNASKGANAVQLDDLSTVAITGSYTDLINKPTIPVVNNATITIQKNGTNIDSFTANQASEKIINITVPTTASDVSALPSSTKYGYSFDLSINSETYVVSLVMKDQDGTAIGTAQTIDLPLESVVINGSYDNASKKIILTLQSGSTVDVPVGDLIAGLQSEINSTNKLSADLIKDGAINKTVTATEKETWNNKQDVISDLESIRSGASKGATALQSVPDEYITETELNDKGYLTSYTETDPVYTADKPNLATKEEVNQAVDNINIALANVYTKEEVDQAISSVQPEMTADKVEYNNGSITTVQEALDQLLYVMPSITSFSGGGTYEVGQSITSVNLSWALNKSVTSQSINQGIGSIDKGLRRYTHTPSSPIKSNVTYTLTVSDGKNSTSKSTYLVFRYKRYWGVSTKDTLTNADILALSKELTTGRTQSRIFNCSGGNYFYFVIPSEYCNGISFKVGGLAFSDMEVSDITLTNESGASVACKVYRSKNLQTGSAISVEVL